MAIVVVVVVMVGIGIRNYPTEWSSPQASKAKQSKQAVRWGGVHPAGWLESFNFFYKKFGPFCNSSAVL